MTRQRDGVDLRSWWVRHNLGTIPIPHVADIVYFIYLGSNILQRLPADSGYTLILSCFSIVSSAR